MIHSKICRTKPTIVENEGGSMFNRYIIFSISKQGYKGIHMPLSDLLYKKSELII